jgi:hypothetical protein
MGISFPDGMIVIEGPNLGCITDTMVWLTSSMRATMVLINAEREALGQRHLYLYADKIFRTDCYRCILSTLGLCSTMDAPFE